MDAVTGRECPSFDVIVENFVGVSFNDFIASSSDNEEDQTEPEDINIASKRKNGKAGNTSVFGQFFLFLEMSQLKSSKVLSIFNGIISRNREAMKAFAAGDSSGVAAIYDPNCYMMPYGRESIHGRDKVRDYIGLDIKEGAKKLLLETSEVEGTEDWAFERGVYRMDGTKGSESGSHDFKETRPCPPLTYDKLNINNI
uniref:Uncharacterized protein n=1 Tax=Romanomermis culicivorax TaxID=13658 RepID=A0A915L7S8_ROMCU